jgi:hypothetical protein
VHQLCFMFVTVVNGGPVTVVSSSTSASALDAYSSAAGFVGNGILGKVPAGTLGANLLFLQEGSNTLLQV